MKPVPSVSGALDLPRAGVEAIGGRVRVRGWLRAEQARVVRVELWVDRLGAIDVAHDMPSGVEARKGPTAGTFVGSFVAPPGLTEVHAELWVELDSGARIRCDARPCALVHRDSSSWCSFDLPSGETIRACLDAPSAGAVVARDEALAVSGWIVSSGQPIRRVWIEGPSGRTSMEVGIARPDVGDLFPEVPRADRCGVGAELTAPGAEGLLDLVLWLELADGARHRWMSRRIRVGRGEDSIAPASSRWRPRWITSWSEGAVVGTVARAVAQRVARSRQRWLRSSDASGVQSDEGTGAPEGLAGDDPLARQRAFERWQDTNRLQPRLLDRLRQVALELAPGAPRVSMLLPLHEASVARADACIASVRAQLLDGWELCVLDDGTSGPYLGPKLRGLAEVDPRIRVFSAPRSLAGAAALALLLKEADGELVAILDPDVELAPDALLHVIARLRSDPHLQLLYTDEDRIDASGRRFAPRFKPPWSPALALTFDYLGRLTVFRRALLERIGGPDPAMGSAHERDLVMRAVEAAGDDHIGHIAKIACHRSPSRALDAATEDDPDARCIAAALGRRGLRARPVRIDARDADPEAPTHALVWSPALLRETPVTILIPTRDRIDLLRRCVASLERTVDAEALSLLIVDDHSEEARTLAYLRELESHPRVRVVRPTRARTGFDFAHLVNFGVSHVTTPYVLLLNNDTEAIAPGWLEEMVGWASVPGVAVVGARLTFPDETIAHAGVVIGPQGGLADHVFRGSPRGSPGYLGLAHRARDVSAVTGACLLTSTAIYRELGGLDEARFAVDYNDIDYCLRVIASGRRVVFTPGAELTHVGGASRGVWDDVTEQASFLRVHAAFHDRYTNPSCDIESAELQIDPTRFAHTDHAPDGLRVLVVPSTSPSDASSELSDYVDGLVRADPTLRIEILARDVRFEGDVDRWHGHVRAVAVELAEPQVDLVVAHETHAIWGVELARVLGCPSVWYLGGRGDAGELAHELGAHPQARALLERSLARATRVVFASALCLPELASSDRGRHRALPIGVSIPRIESFRRAHSRAALRARHRVSQDELLVLIVDEGGGADDERGRHVRGALSDLGERVRCFALRGSLAEPLDGGPALARCDLLGMADLLVMSDGTSEIHPRVLLEALSLGVPVIGPGVPGVGEVVADELSGFIADAASRESIERALRRWIDDPSLRATFGVRAGVQARRLMDTSRLIERHVALLREAVLAS